MARYPFRIVTYRTGVKIDDRAASSRAAAERFYQETVEAARLTALSQRAPRRVELVHGGVVIAFADLPARAAVPAPSPSGISDDPLTT